MKYSNVIRVPTTIDSFFKLWLEFLRPFHKLTERELDVAACLLKNRYKLSKVIFDPDILDKVVMSSETKEKIMEECGITITHYRVILGRLARNKIIVNGKINPRFIPNVVEDKGNFHLLLLFDIK